MNRRGGEVMACSRKVREAARRYWLLGYSDEKIIPRLTQEFPDEKTPTRLYTIYDWRKKDQWSDDKVIPMAPRRTAKTS